MHDIPMNIAIISTSPRENSYSLRFSNYLKKELETVSESEYPVETIHVVDFSACDIPVFSKGNINRETSTFQDDFLSAWEKSELVFFVTPEYNFTLNGELVNAFHQLSNPTYAHLFHNKVFALVGISSGRGGKYPCIELTTILNKLISFSGQYSFVSPKFFESHETHKNINELLELVGPGKDFYKKFVDEFIDYSLVMANCWR